MVNMVAEETKKKDQKEAAMAAHVLLLPFPVQGHINPMLQFAKRLAAKGIQVTLATTVFLATNMHAHHLHPVRLATISDGYDKGGFLEAASADAYHSRLDEVGPSSLSDLLAASSFTCLIYDTSLHWALDVARQLGIVTAAFSTQSSAAFSVYHRAFDGQLVVPSSGEAVQMPGLPPMMVSDLPSLVLHEEGSAYLPILKLKLKQFSNLDHADFVLINTVHELEEEATNYLKRHWRSVKTIGPTIPPMYLNQCDNIGDTDYALQYYKQDTNYRKWLDNKPSGSVIYVSFGSIALMRQEQMEEIAWGLLGTGKYFLWVVREHEAEKLPCHIVSKAKEKGMVVSWCSQLEVLAHPSVGCFVTHCGWNSILEALAQGVPMVGVPQWTDQPTNAKYMEDVWSVGIRARADETGIFRRDNLMGCVNEVMDGEKRKQMQKNAGELKRTIRNATGHGGSSEQNIDEFVMKLITK